MKSNVLVSPMKFSPSLEKPQCESQAHARPDKSARSIERRAPLRERVLLYSAWAILVLSLIAMFVSQSSVETSPALSDTPAESVTDLDL
ncbi:MAG: hypothetical protein J7641_17980 [Cyanobacteria bacterium SID2]|nr:hypothetical protein [Cyanobacteria bacterium SID2]MBP0006341.1 hypothetical protein [Cyanobacteria bacterium SBC]